MVAPDVAHAQSTTDYDSDNDGLIEVANLAQLNAIRWDLDGDGSAASGSDTTNYTAAFPNAVSGMGCPTSGSPTGCEGYELTADLNFDTNGDGYVNASDDIGDWWDSGAGWLPIGTSSGTFNAKFDGGGHVVSHLFIRRSGGDIGLFGAIGADGEVSNLGLADVGIYGVPTGDSINGYVNVGGVNVGGLAGQNAGTITASLVEPRASSVFYNSVEDGSITTGGLVGKNSGTISGSYAIAEVESESGQVGGLVGVNSGTIIDSYAAGEAESDGGGNAGGLVGRLDSSGSITDSYSLSRVSGTPASGSTLGGLVGAKSAASTVTASYWSFNNNRQTTISIGTGKWRHDLREPTSNTGIYAGWERTRWDFVDYKHLPLLKADWDGDGTATRGEFGDQDPEPEFADDAVIDDMVLTVRTPFTSPALPKITNSHRFDGLGGTRRELTGWPEPYPTDWLSLVYDDGSYKITGTPPLTLAKTQFTWSYSDEDDGVATLSFYLTVSATGDYDGDDDGLIEVAYLAQLNAIRWDLDGDGASTNSGYATAFAGADTGMGCNEDEADAADQVCEGYELLVDLDFDSDGDGDVDATDHSGSYWNAGKGWVPIGTSSTVLFNSTFDGNGHTITNLFVNEPTSTGAGLFGNVGADAVIANLGLRDVDITETDYAGAIAGANAGSIEASYASGEVSVTGTGIKNAGGLAGTNTGTIEGSYSLVDVTTSALQAGGLTGENSGSIIDSYAAGTVSRTATIGSVGGLVGLAKATSVITDSYAVGAVTRSGTGGAIGGLVGATTTGATVTASYWDTELTGQATSGGGTGKTTSELQTPTSNTGIYADWATTRWDFYDANHFPLLKADWDGNGWAGWYEFGGNDQDSWPRFARSAAIGDLFLAQDVSYTSPAAFPEAVGGNGEIVYSLSTLPAGLSLNSERKLTGTPTAPSAKATITYTAADTDDDKATLTFYLTVLAPQDYDSDDDGLIEVGSLALLDLAQLNAIRWDLDGDGASTNSGYATAFPNPVTGMGCNGDEADAADQVCEGYELTADLDFDSDYWDSWNDGDGWLPIGTSSGTFNAKFDGGGHVVSNLGIYRSGGDIGLFGVIGADAEVSNLGLVDVSIYDGGANVGGVNVGALAGQNAGTITASFVDTSASSSLVQDGSVTTGGLVGKNSGTISGSYAANSFVSSDSGQVGGLVGVNSGTITESYAAANVYSDGGGNAGGLVGRLGSSGSITDSYSLSSVYGEPAGGSTLGGLVGAKSASSTVTTSYWGTYTSEQATSAGGTRKTFYELHTPTSNTGIYAGWATARWDFVDASNFPLLKADWDGDGTATWGEFGDQDPEPEFADGTAIDDMVLTVGAAFTSPALPEITNSHHFRHGLWLAPLLPDGLELNYDSDSDDYRDRGWKISGTSTEVLAKTQFTWNFSDLDDGVATLTFYLTVNQSSDLRPVLGRVADKVYPQGEAVDFTLPAATGADSHPNYVYALTPDVSGIGLSFNASTRKLSGTPSAPKAKVSFTYTATETSDSDGTVESASRRFTIGVKPKKPANFSGTAGDTTVSLAWTAIPGVTGWEVKQGSDAWTAIAGSDATTNGHTVTGLTNDTAYTFKVRAFVGTGNTRVGGVESDEVTETPLSDGRPVLGGVANKVHAQGEAVDFTLPAATGGDGHPSYVYTLTPDVSAVGLAFNASTRKLSGTPSAPKAKVSFTYTATESSDPDGTVESASRTFTIGVKPKKPANFSGTAGDTTVDLSWAAIPGVTGWEVKQGSDAWTAITGSDATTNGHTATGLTNNTAYTFKVRAFVGSGNTRVDGVESDEVTETPLPSSDKRPVLGAVSGKAYVQGEAVDFTLPAATSGDSHPNYVYTLTPDVSGVGLSFDASTRALSGTPSAPKAKVSFTYTATESSDPDGTVESASRTFTIGVKPKKPANFSGTAGETTVDLAWAAISGVSGWEVKQGSGSWTAIAGSDGTTNGHTVTGLTNDTAYTFKVRAFVGTGDTRVDGVESDEVTVTTLPLERRPVLGEVADKVYPQGEVVNFTLPAATGGDGHPSYVYTLTPDVSGVGLTFNASTRTLSGTPSAPEAKVSFTYTATEAADPDGTVESASSTFTIGVRPKKPENFSVTADGGWAVLTWTAISGVDGWQVKQGSGSWKNISRSGAATSRTAISLSGGADYTFKVRAFVGTGDTRVDGVESDALSGTQAVDYDLDDDGLIEISDVTQLQASRLDKNGDGVTDDPSMQGLYNRAFPGAADRMGCPSTCTGYELATDDLTPRPRG